MAERVFHIVDVFAEERYSGNQLAVFLDGHVKAMSQPQLEQTAQFEDGIPLDVFTQFVLWNQY